MSKAAMAARRTLVGLFMAGLGVRLHDFNVTIKKYRNQTLGGCE